MLKLKKLISYLCVFTLIGCFLLGTAAQAGELKRKFDVIEPINDEPKVNEDKAEELLEQPVEGETDEHEEAILNAGMFITDIIDLIDKVYMGSELTFEQIVQGALKGIFGELDEYSEYFSPKEAEGFLTSVSSEIYVAGILYIMGDDGYPLILEVTDGMPAKKAGIESGDKIIKINGEDINSFSLDDIRGLIVSDHSKEVSFTIKKKNGGLKDFKLFTALTKLETVYAAKLEEIYDIKPTAETDKVRYIQITQFIDNTAEEFKKTVEQLKKEGVERLIIDLRDNGGGDVEQALEICRLIVPKGRIISLKDSQGNVEYADSELKNPDFKKIVVLANQNTASASEIVASAVKESKIGVIVGAKTYGKAVVQYVIDLNEMGAVKLTAKEWFSRTGKKINKVGVEPDIAVKKYPYLDYYGVEADSEELKAALNELGYSKGGLTAFQNDNGLEPGLTDDTITAINEALYEKELEKNEAVKKSIEEILK